MVTRLRIRKAGGIYHVFNRGVLKKPIFHDRDDREYMLILLEECTTRYGVEFRSYCLMTNHIHFHLCTPDANIAEAMHWLFTCFACRFNAKYERIGHVFEARYKSPLVQPGWPELLLSRYVHRNPAVAGMVKCAADYPWSSMRGYVNPSERPDWLRVEAVLDSIPSPETDVLRTYLSFVDSDRKRDALADVIFTSGSAVGSLEFIGQIADQHGLRLSDTLRTEQVLSAVAQVHGPTDSDAGPVPASEGTALTATVYLLMTFAGLTREKAGQVLGGRSGRTIQRHLATAKGLMAADRNFSEFVSSCLVACGSADRLWTI